VPVGTQQGDEMTLKQFGAFEFNPPDLYDERDLRGDFIIKFKIV